MRTQPQTGASDIYKQFELADQRYSEKVKVENGFSKGQNTNSSIIYKQYTVKDYKQMLQTSQSLKMGGLGPNIGGEEWEKARRKQEQI